MNADPSKDPIKHKTAMDLSRELRKRVIEKLADKMIEDIQKNERATKEKK